MIWPILEKMRSHETEFKRVQWNFLASVISRGYTFLFWFQYWNGSEFLGGRSSSKYLSISWMAMAVFVVPLAEIQSSRLYQIESVFWADDEAGTGTLTYKNRKQISLRKKKMKILKIPALFQLLARLWHWRAILQCCFKWKGYIYMWQCCLIYRLIFVLCYQRLWKCFCISSLTLAEKTWTIFKCCFLFQ